MGVLDQFRSIKRGLKLQPADMDIRKLFPMFAPASFFESDGWPGPYILPGADGVGVTWALDLPGGGMRYLDRSMRAHWEAIDVDWKASALANLSDATKDRLFTHGLGRKNGGLFAVVMMHADGWGPSRLLLREALQRTFPEGYRVSVPEMSCGFALSRELDDAEEATITGIIAKCFGDGTRPLAPGIFEPDEILPNWSAV
jgi:hypothetical protein